MYIFLTAVEERGFYRHSKMFVTSLNENLLVQKEKRELIAYRIPLMDLIKNDMNINDPIIDYIIDFCPEPGAFLSDEIILKRGLKPYEDDKEELCLGCRKCGFVFARLR